MVKEIALRHDAQQLYKQLNGAATSHSVASRSKNYLAEYRQRIGKKDVRALFPKSILYLQLHSALLRFFVC